MPEPAEGICQHRDFLTQDTWLSQPGVAFQFTSPLSGSSEWLIQMSVSHKTAVHFPMGQLGTASVPGTDALTAHRLQMCSMSHFCPSRNWNLCLLIKIPLEIWVANTLDLNRNIHIVVFSFTPSHFPPSSPLSIPPALYLPSISKILH